MTKVYGIYGKTTVEMNLPVGKATLPLVFTRGCLDRKNYRPASFITNKKSIQDMIESSPLFGRTIKLVKVYGAEAAQEEEATPAPAPKKAVSKPVQAPEPAEEKPTEYPDVTTKEQLIAAVKAHGAKAGVLADDAKLKKFIETKGLSFPNYQF